MKSCIYQTDPQECIVDTSDCHSVGDMTTTMMLPKCGDPTEYDFPSRTGKICYKGCICTPENCDRRVPMLELNRIYNTDYLDGLKALKSNSVDMVLTDPPYNISKENEQRDRSKFNSPIMRRKKALNYDFGEWDNMERDKFLSFTKEWLTECCRVLKEGGVIVSFFNKEDISYLGWEAKNMGVRTRTIFTWHKTNPVPSFRKVNYLSACEFAWIGSKGGFKTFNFKQQKNMHNFFQTPNKSSYGKTEHPTEKPLVLMEHFIEIHSNEGDLILDPFIGSGTTAIACINTGRRYIGFELDEDYYDIANKRIEERKV